MQNGLTYSTDEIGASITIDETHLRPNLLSDYIDMVPGNAYDVQLSTTETSRIEAPYTSKCRNDYPEICRNYGAYSMSKCSQGCVQHQVNKGCSCTEASMLEGELEEEYKAILKMVCNISHVNCIINHWETLGMKGMEEQMLKPCTPECSRTKYSVRVFTAKHFIATIGVKKDK